MICLTDCLLCCLRALVFCLPACSKPSALRRAFTTRGGSKRGASAWGTGAPRFLFNFHK